MAQNGSQLEVAAMIFLMMGFLADLGRQLIKRFKQAPDCHTKNQLKVARNSTDGQKQMVAEIGSERVVSESGNSSRGHDST